MLRNALCQALFVVCGAAAASACRLQDPMALESTDVIELDLENGSALADGVSQTWVKAILKGDTPTGTEITFSTDGGRFAGAPASTPREIKLKSASRTVQATLVGGVDPMVATVRIAAGGFVVERRLTLEPAPPVRIEISSDIARAPANGTSGINVVTRALRSPGLVSRGTRLDMAVTLDGVSVPGMSGTMEIDSLGFAKRVLVSRTPGMYRLISSAVGVADTLMLEFTQ